VIRNYVIFQVLTAVAMNCSLYYHLTPCNWMKGNVHFLGTYRLHLQNGGVSQASIIIIGGAVLSP
jgi:hypothetical protein